MNAGTGVTHSEYNPSNSEPLEFLQIWIEPNLYGIDPGYQQKRFDRQPGLRLIASPDARDGSLLIHQDALLYRLRLDTGEAASHPLLSGRTVYVHVVSGGFTIEGEPLDEGDGATITSVDNIQFKASESGEALVFDLP
jgi:redox-sensitive bicupin YhaK (pirin superfamily)